MHEFRFLLFGLTFIFSTSLTVFCKSGMITNASDEERHCSIIRSGLTGGAGYSLLNLDNSIRPQYFTSEFYTIQPSCFFSVGSIIRIQPRFFPERLKIRVDPSFVKYSYGSHQWQNNDVVSSSLDIDVETIRLPISLQLDLLRNSSIFNPFIRGGYGYAYVITYNALFQWKVMIDGNSVVYSETGFDFARYQNSLFISGGVDVSLRNLDFMVEVVLEKSDGIHKEKFGSDFLKTSSTTNYFLKLAILF